MPSTVQMILTSTTRAGCVIRWPGVSAGRAKALEPTDPITSANKAALTMIDPEVLCLSQIHTNFFVYRLQVNGTSQHERAAFA